MENGEQKMENGGRRGDEERVTDVGISNGEEVCYCSFVRDGGCRKREIRRKRMVIKKEKVLRGRGGPRKWIYWDRLGS